jgi:hypothetical protein
VSKDTTPTVEDVTAPTRAHEMRYSNDNRCRVFTVRQQKDKPGLYQVGICSNEEIKAADLLAQFRTGAATVLDFSPESVYENQTREQVQELRLKWRTNCNQAGLKNIKKWTDRL